MSDLKRPSRRQFLYSTVAGTVSLPLVNALALEEARADTARHKSEVFRVNGCPVHDGQLRHVGVDALLHLLSVNGTKFYRTTKRGALSGPTGLIAVNDVVILKVNAQWKCRGCTNTDVLRGLIHRILGHPDGFIGEVVIFENGQGRPAAFDGIHNDSDKPEYKPFPELDGKVIVNAEQPDLTTINYLVSTVFAGKPVSTFLMDRFSNVWVSSDDHETNGYRRIGEPRYPMHLISLLYHRSGKPRRAEGGRVDRIRLRAEFEAYSLPRPQGSQRRHWNDRRAEDRLWHALYVRWHIRQAPLC